MQCSVNEGGSFEHRLFAWFEWYPASAYGLMLTKEVVLFHQVATMGAALPETWEVDGAFI